ncbi:hypothetical protein [Chelativorans sp. J32]|uniref:hypothetical protein n=1 Tax=Chelativorans sp. J32 TaxID=935840 RepID=UPI0012EBCF87|nr:hypothetical protein [Chelativorans sp. J32]
MSNTLGDQLRGRKNHLKRPAADLVPGKLQELTESFPNAIKALPEIPLDVISAV